MMADVEVKQLSELSHDPDAVKWAAAFKAQFPDNELAQDEGLMIGWFANAMMAMHDHLEAKATRTTAAELEEARAEIARLRDGISEFRAFVEIETRWAATSDLPKWQKLMGDLDALTTDAGGS